MKFIEKGAQVNGHNLLFPIFYQDKGKVIKSRRFQAHKVIKSRRFQAYKGNLTQGFLKLEKWRKKLDKQGSDASNGHSELKNDLKALSCGYTYIYIFCK